MHALNVLKAMLFQNVHTSGEPSNESDNFNTLTADSAVYYKPFSKATILCLKMLA